MQRNAAYTTETEG